MLWTGVALELTAPVELDEVDELPADELADDTIAELDVTVVELVTLDEDD